MKEIKSKSVFLQMDSDLGSGIVVPDRECREKMGACGIRFATQRLLAPSAGDIFTPGETIGGNGDHCNEVMRARGCRSLVTPMRRRLIIARLDQHLRADAVNAVKQGVDRAEMQGGVEAGLRETAMTQQH